jgi:hypothetical protein
MSGNFFIAYDLDSPGQNYAKIEQAIHQCGAAVKVQLSLFYVKSPNSKSEILEHCLKSMDGNDRLIVIEANDAIWQNCFVDSYDFMQQRWNP